MDDREDSDERPRTRIAPGVHVERSTSTITTYTIDPGILSPRGLTIPVEDTSAFLERLGEGFASRPEAIAALPSTLAETVWQTLDTEIVHPFTEGPPPEQGVAGRLLNVVSVVSALASLPGRLLDTVIGTGLSAITPPGMGFPAAVASTTMHFGIPHGHAHPPSMVPPAPPVPMPSTGPALPLGCVSVLIGGEPALRAGDVGLAISCCPVTPVFDIITGSASVFIGGHRAARVCDFTRSCNPLGPLGLFSTATAAFGALDALTSVLTIAAHGTAALHEAGEADARDTSAAEAEASAAAATGQATAAIVAAAQAAADLTSASMKQTIGMDPGVPPPLMGMLIGAGVMTVQVGGLPLPPLGDMFNSRIHEAVAGAVRRRTRRPDPAPTRPRPRDAAGAEDAQGRPRPQTEDEAVGPCGRKGEPVDVTTGAVFFSATLFDSGSLFRWSIHYASDRARERSPVGRGYRHSYQQHLRVRLHRCVYVDERGREIRFPRFDPGVDSVSSRGWTLTRHGRGVFTLSRRDRPRLELVDRGGVARLSRVIDTDESRELRLVRDETGQLRALEETDSRSGRMRHYELSLDSLGHVTAIRERGVLTPLVEHAYDRQGRLVAWRDSSGGESRLAYDQGHRLTERRAPHGYAYRWAYDTEGRCIATSGADGLHCGAFTYGPGVTTCLDRDGGTWKWHFDPDGVVTRMIDPYGGELVRERDPETGRVVAEVDSTGRRTTLLYDAAGGHIARRDAFGNLRPAAIDAWPEEGPRPRELPSTTLGFVGGPPLPASDDARAGRVIDGLASALGDAVLTYLDGRWQPAEPRDERDALGRVVARTDVRGASTRWSYSRSGALASRRDADGREWRFEPERDSLIGRVWDPLGALSHYAYSDFGEVVGIADPHGNRYRYERDRTDRICLFAIGDRVIERYDWGPGHVLSSRRDADGAPLVIYGDHDRGLPRSIELSTGGRYALTYDDAGRVRDARSESHTVEIRREHSGRVISDLRDGRGVQYLRLDEHDEQRLLGIARVTRRVVDGRVELTGPGGLSMSIEALGAGVVARRLGSGTSEVTRFDPSGRLLARISWGERSGPRATRYDYTPAGLLELESDSETGRRRFLLDAAGRLVGAHRADGTETRIELDAAGNVVSKPGLALARVGAANQLVSADERSFRYDARGNLGEIAGPDGAVTRYHYDSLDQLVRVEERDASGALLRDPWTAEHDALGRRTRHGRGKAQAELYWEGHRLAATVSPAGETRIYVYASDDALSPVAFLDIDADDRTGELARVYYVFSGTLGEPLFIEDAVGTVVWRATWSDPYGQLDIDPSRLIDYDLRWPGHLFIPETGLHYNRYRDYSPWLGRYLQLDPKGHAGGPNLYAYCANPTSAVDILGLSGCGEDDPRTPRATDPPDTRPPTKRPNRPDHDHGPRPEPVVDFRTARHLDPEDAAVLMDHAIRGAVRDWAAGEPARAARRRELEAERADAGARRAAAEASRDRAARGAAMRDQERINAEIAALRSQRVFEAAYDPEDGRLVVTRSGLPASPLVNRPKSPPASDTTAGMCAMPGAVGAIQHGRAGRGDSTSDPIYVSNGGYVYTGDPESPYAHRTACGPCAGDPQRPGDSILDANPQIRPVGRHRREVIANPIAHPSQRGALGKPNVTTRITNLDDQ